MACSTVSSTLSSDSEDSSDDDDDDDMSQSRTASRVAHTSNSKENNQGKKIKNPSKISEKTSKCFNFDLDTIQMSLVQKMRQEELLKGKKKKRKGGVRFTTDADADPGPAPEHSPLENVSPFHSERRSERCRGVEEDIAVGVEVDVHNDSSDAHKIDQQNKNKSKSATATISSALNSSARRDAQTKSNGNGSLLEMLGNILSSVFLSRIK